MSMVSSPVAGALHADAIVVDAVCPLVMDNVRHVDLYRAGGANLLGVTAGGWDAARPCLDRLAMWRRAFNEREDIVPVHSAVDARRAKADGKLGIYFHLQGANPIEDNLDFVDLFKALGVGMVQLAYNVRNRVGDGCEEVGNAGLSRFGRDLVQRLEEARVIIDCSHTGDRTSLDAVAAASKPVVLSHSNVASVFPNARNVSDDLIRAIAASGGVIGIAGFPGLVRAVPHPSLDDFAAHIEGVVETVGIDHVGLGIDYYIGQAGIMDDTSAKAAYDENVRLGLWSDAYPPPPYRYPSGIDTPDRLDALTAHLTERGWSEEDLRKLLGENWLRVMAEVWGA